MINLRSKDEMGTNVAMIAALVAMAGTLLFMLLVPKPSAKGVAQAQLRAEGQVLDEITMAKKAKEAGQAKVAKQTWPGGAQEVGPGALKDMTKLATSYQVKLSGFRPQKMTPASGLELLPYAVTAEGSFPDVLRFVKAIEDPANKLAVHQLQINSADANSDQVTATVGITAYRVADKPATAPARPAQAAVKHA